MGSLHDREVASSASYIARVRISNPVSEGQCHLFHLTILRMLYWPSLAVSNTEVITQQYIYFYFFSTGAFIILFSTVKQHTTLVTIHGEVSPLYKTTNYCAEVVYSLDFHA